MSKKKIIEAHGKVESSQPTTLEQVWGYNELSKYGTVDEAVYQKQLDEMHRADLESHARRVGTVIVESTDRLRKKLLNDFRVYVSLLNKPAEAKKKLMAPDEAARKVMSEGR